MLPTTLVFIELCSDLKVLFHYMFSSSGGWFSYAFFVHLPVSYWPSLHCHMQMLPHVHSNTVFTLAHYGFEVCCAMLAWTGDSLSSLEMHTSLLSAKVGMLMIVH